MSKIKFKGVAGGFVEKNYPLLADSISEIEGLTDKQKEQVAGLAIEVAIKAGSEPGILFQDDFDFLIEDEED